MNRINIQMLLSAVDKYNEDAHDMVKKAYDYACKMHFGQKRQSGEDYIVHPLMVAYILASMHADGNTICAGLLHDTLEDTIASAKELETLFNKDVACLVLGVTNFKDIDFHTKEETNYANIRKIITSIITDPRIIIIKLSDRLHNMRTLDFKEDYKRKIKSQETMDVYAPLAGYIGAYHIKTELEDLSFKYLNPEKYYEILEKKCFFEENNYKEIFCIENEIENFLNSKNINNYLKVRTKNIYGIYKKMQKGFSIDEIHDLVAIKIVVDDKVSCYKTLCYIHEKFHPINYKFKDYISMPKTNMYQSLHTTVFGPNNRLIQFQIRTKQMDNFNSYGLTSYWDMYKNNAKDDMLFDLKNNFKFFKTISYLNEKYQNPKDFVLNVQKELFSNIIYVYDSNGVVYELAKGSTIIDFAYKIDPTLINFVIGGYINNHLVSPNAELNYNDRVCVLYNKVNVRKLKK